MKTVLFLTDDYWHHADTIRPLADILFPPAEWNLVFTKNPQKMFAVPDLDLLVSFKDPVENDQIPTPVWCDQKWTDTLLEKIQSGLGFIPVHAAVTDMEESHPRHTTPSLTCEGYVQIMKNAIHWCCPR